jgi:hypothetical protein
MFSRRTDWHLQHTPFTTLVQKKRLEYSNLVDLTESNPTKCGFDFHRTLPQSLLADPRILRYEPDPKGLLPARKSIVEFYRRKEVNLDSGDIFLTSGSSESYSYIFRLLCNPGDSVLVPLPGYPLFQCLTELNDIEVRHYHLRYDGEWTIDFDSLTSSITEKTKALVVIHPNNPTGSFVKRFEVDRLRSILTMHNIPLISDEVFSGFGLEASTSCPPSFLNVQGMPLVFSLNGISKLAALPQLKLAWMCISGNAALKREALQRLEIIADT